jgi:ATP-binding cassette, subfamily C, bacterial CydD
LAMVDLVDHVTDHHSLAGPMRRSLPLSMLAVLAVTAVVHWPAAVVLLLSTALIPLNMRLAGLFAQEGADRALAATQRLNAAVLDSFRGLQTLRELGAVSRRRYTLSGAQERLNEATMSVLRRAFLSGLIMDVVVTFSIAANATYIGLSLLGYVEVPHAPTLTLFSGLLVLLICPMYFAPMRAAAATFHQRERAAVAAAALSRIAGSAPVAATRAGRSALTEPVGVVLNAVRYSHPGAVQDTITADIDIAPGTWTVVAGASGAGKTTLLSLIAGMRQPTGGHVQWTSTSHQTPTLGDCVWIGQRTVLLDATVRDNIRLGRSDATEHQIREAVAAAGLNAVVAGLPHGLDTRLGEGGWGISTGEARRIAIARAMLRVARLWLLDEPTAHLDADAERDVLEALRRAGEGCTVIVATHSFALTAIADTVLVIEDGVLHELRPVPVP